MNRDSVIAGLDPDTYRKHTLHGLDRVWPETNCYVDLWIEVLSALGKEPHAILGFTLAQDFEGDQITFFKMPNADLESLYGIVIQELAIFDDVARHAATQVARGRLPLIEVDGFHLPDTKGLSYASKHTKTTIAVNRIDVERRELDYFHNAGFFRLSGPDFDGVLGRLPEQRNDDSRLFPYTEFAKFDRAADVNPEPAQVLALLARHYDRRPAENPVRRFREAFPDHLAHISRQPPEFFHDYTFNTMRQLGANFELLASHLDWLSGHGIDGFDAASREALALSEAAKTLQFQLARAVARRKMDGLTEPLDRMSGHWDRVMDHVGSALHQLPAPAAITA